MMKLNGTGTKILKIFHLVGVCCWLGGAGSMLVLNLGTQEATSPTMLNGINHASHLIDLWIVVVLGLYVCLVTGFLYGLFTPWGFVKFRWVICKWIITCICFASGWIFLGSWESAMLEISKSMGDLQDPVYAIIRARHFYLSLIQISLLVFMLAISVIKPWKKRRG